MKSATAPNKKARAASRRNRNAISLKEMCRLMRVYGSLKCLRKRQAPGGEVGVAKIGSIRRKFYRWFPDLNERFERDRMGFFVPKFGHVAEMRYREDMRRKDGEVLAGKRTAHRRQQRNGWEAEGLEGDIKLEPGHDPMVSVDIATGTQPLEQPLNVGRGVFDDVELSFYGQTEQDSPDVARSSCSSLDFSEEHSPSGLLESDAPPTVKDVPGKTIEECCDEILGSEYDDVVPDFLFD